MKGTYQRMLTGVLLLLFSFVHLSAAVSSAVHHSSATSPTFTKVHQLSTAATADGAFWCFLADTEEVEDDNLDDVLQSLHVVDLFWLSCFCSVSDSLFTEVTSIDKPSAIPLFVAYQNFRI